MNTNNMKDNHFQYSAKFKKADSKLNKVANLKFKVNNFLE